MIKFNSEAIDMFLGVVRKYMQLRGGLSQKELAENINVGISTMSRFLNQKTKEYDQQMIAAMVAYLQIPLHEMIEFVEEESTATFKNLVQFYKAQNQDDKEEDVMAQSLGDTGRSSTEEKTRLETQATIKGVKMTFGNNKDLTIREKLNQLSPRQKGFLTDFLDLDVEGKDLIVDIGNSLFRYFKQGQTDF